jgi:biotin transport system substrate-specific component
MTAIARRPTLADALVTPSSGLRSVLLVMAASVVTAMAAQLAVPLPWTPVPLTGQTFAVLLSGAALGWRRGFMAQAIYLAQGACGLPVFAGAAGGAAWLLGPTGGYLLAFPLAAALVGWLAERGWDRRPGTTFLAMIAGSGVIFALGLAQLAVFVPASALPAAGLLPFLPGDALKAGLAAAALPIAWRLAGRHDRA